MQFFGQTKTHYDMEHKNSIMFFFYLKVFVTMFIQVSK
jgi:hypothetical protein